MPKKKKNSIYKFFVLIIIAIALVFYFSYQKSINTALDRNAEAKLFTVEAGESVDSIGEKLEKQKIISSTFYFNLYTALAKKQASLQAGDYLLEGGLSLKEIVDIFVSGRTLKNERVIKVIEGWNAREIGQYLEREGLFQSEELLEHVGFPKMDYRYEKNLPRPVDYSARYSFLADKPSYYGLEGYLFPDTYRIYKDASLGDVVEKVLDNFDNKLDQEMRADIKKQGKSIYEIITMASIIEKEVRNYEDMRIVSGIFWNRIKNGQALESCATLAYILGVNKPQYTTEDTKIDSPYNTYQNRDLPPGPISNPGLNAIKAAIYPIETDYNYFLSRSDNGETVFSRTYNEHLTNKAKYIK